MKKLIWLLALVPMLSWGKPVPDIATSCVAVYYANNGLELTDEAVLVTNYWFGRSGLTQELFVDTAGDKYNFVLSLDDETSTMFIQTWYSICREEINKEGNRV